MEGNPIKVTRTSNNAEEALTRSGGNSRLLQSGSSNMCSKTFINDAVRIWNQAPVFIKDARSIYSAKKAIKEFVLTLPI